MTKRNWYKSSLARECNTKISEIDVKGACFSPLFRCSCLNSGFFWEEPLAASQMRSWDSKGFAWNQELRIWRLVAVGRVERVPGVVFGRRAREQPGLITSGSLGFWLLRPQCQPYPDTQRRMP